MHKAFCDRLKTDESADGQYVVSVNSRKEAGANEWKPLFVGTEEQANSMLLAVSWLLESTHEEMTGDARKGGCLVACGRSVTRSS